MRDEAYGEYAGEVRFDWSTYPMTPDDIFFHYISVTEMGEWEDADAYDYPLVNHPL